MLLGRWEARYLTLGVRAVQGGGAFPGLAPDLPRSLCLLGRYKDGADSPTEDSEKPRVLYSLEFTFDADARVAITIYCQAVEEFLNGTAT